MTMPIRLLVCGGRDLDERAVRDWLARHAFDRVREASRGDKFLDGASYLEVPIGLVIHGGARGADAGADAWARHSGISTQSFSADWAKHGRKAGPMRNERMLYQGQPELVLALPGGAGTADMVRKARTCGLPVIEVRDISERAS